MTAPLSIPRSMQRAMLGEMLVAKGVLTAVQLAEALAAQQKDGDYSARCSCSWDSVTNIK